MVNDYQKTRFPRGEKEFQSNSNLKRPRTCTTLSCTARIIRTGSRDSVLQLRPFSDNHRSGLMAGISIFLYVLVVATSNDTDDLIEACVEPRLLKFLPSKHDRFSPIPTLISSRCLMNSKLGDNIRSDEASNVFFHSLDRDEDGIIEREEVAYFLKDQIGGSQFDSQLEVEAEASTVMDILDQNHDNGLELADVTHYWAQLESLLTAEEVSEWVVYAVQLPSSVGKIFLQNGITGYDFPEIVANSGEVLLNELGLEKVSFRNKIVRNMQARMLGIGTTPEVPKNCTYKLVSCKTVSFSWEKSTARVFPVHSYRIQRRVIHLFEKDSSNESIMTIRNDISLITYPPATSADWITVYVGGETEFVDSGLENGSYYMYRIQAWNSVGRSSWEIIDLSRALEKERCTTLAKNKFDPKVISRTIPQQHIVEEPSHLEWISIPKRYLWGIVFAIQFIYHTTRGFFMVVAMGGAIMRFRRASATSSSLARPVLPFPWFWNGINRLCLKVTGYECIPRSMLGDKEALMLQQKMHDERVMATGLRGYAKLTQKKEEYVDNHKGNRKNEVSFVDSQKIDRTSVFSMSKKFKSTGNLHERKGASPLRDGSLATNVFSWKRSIKATHSSESGYKSESSYGFVSFDESDELPCENVDIAPTLDQLEKKLDIIDDGSVCIVCQKKFKFGKRYKHHCSRCMATFCHKHGKSSHNNLISCKVPGNCLCGPCLEKQRQIMVTRRHFSELH